MLCAACASVSCRVVLAAAALYTESLTLGLNFTDYTDIHTALAALGASTTPYLGLWPWRRVLFTVLW